MKNVVNDLQCVPGKKILTTDQQVITLLNTYAYKIRLRFYNGLTGGGGGYSGPSLGEAGNSINPY